MFQTNLKQDTCLFPLFLVSGSGRQYIAHHTHAKSKWGNESGASRAFRRVPVCISAVATAISLQICLGLLLSVLLTSPVHWRPIPVCDPSQSCPHLGSYKGDWDKDMSGLEGQLTSQLSSQRGKSHKVRMTSTADRLAHQQERDQGIGTNQKAVKFSQQDYETLRKQFLERGRLFEDNCFPAEHKSLGYNELGPYSAKTRGVVWKRPTVRSQWEETHSNESKHCLHCNIVLWLMN